LRDAEGGEQSMSLKVGLMLYDSENYVCFFTS